MWTSPLDWVTSEMVTAAVPPLLPVIMSTAAVARRLGLVFMCETPCVDAGQITLATGNTNTLIVRIRNGTQRRAGTERSTGTLDRKKIPRP